MADYVMITNWLEWGKLVRTWASGVNQFDHGYSATNPVPPIPTSLDDFNRQCAWANVGMVLPTQVKAVQFIQSSDDAVLVRLPARAMASLTVDAAYAPPQFYADYLTPSPPKPFDADFRTCRIGDYSISQCG